MRAIVWVFACVAASAVQAEISINQLSVNSYQLPAIDGVYNIPQELGQTVGSNLFHSFDNFNLNAGETAQFIGSEQIQNVISRVTGNEPSLINGTIRSLMPNADFYFLNPNGIVFGESAQLQVPNSFHASTADYLKLSDGGEFHARFPEQDILTVAPVASFGFLTDSPAPIAVQESYLAVPPEQTLSLIGGDLTIQGQFLGLNEVGIPLFSAYLSAPSGQINLVSQASHSEVSLANSTLSLSTNAQGGSITSINSLMDVSGNKGGNIFIRSGNLSINNGVLNAETINQDGGSIDVEVNDTFILQGVGGLVSGITTTTRGAGQGGSINLRGKQLILNDKSIISTITLGSGKAGALTIFLTEDLTISGKYIPEQGTPSGIFSSSQSTDANAGQAGRIEIEARNIRLSGNTAIFTETYGPGAGNTLVIKVKDTLTLSNMELNERITGGGIFSNTHSRQANAGDAGIIEIEAGNITLTSGTISTSTSGTGNGGYIDLKVVDTLTISQYEDWGSTTIATGVVSDSDYEKNNAGSAGDIAIQANTIRLTDDATILARAKNASGGNINLTIPNLLYLQDADITTSVRSGESDGGNLSIKNPTFVVLNQGQITAQAYEGQGGNIQIAADQFLKSPSSLVSASSRLGIDGNIEITSPDETISSGLLTLSKRFSEQIQIRDTCKAAIAGQLPTEFRPPLTFRANMYHFPNDFVEDWIPSSASRLRFSTCE
ncbi:filamentous hemagglutinin N-terminal domain-containing protein [Candidatus Albibeggiatoa sp. nov. NOAA]|uniref:two-partner secretion domain-containing protein n=1 Tax=Candidatus Albibeggiatoa sp. nov. NOAA TaxID=3162724 RepID=UPI0033005023|nr:filamentous hemagglutinin N-terminal domain-containing protein [Thiotrichaceae bacterium]